MMDASCRQAYTETKAMNISDLPDALADRIEPEPNTGCWLWTGATAGLGYSQVRIAGRRLYAHRAVYEFFKGAVPVGLEMDHLCRVRPCVNPAHVEAVTHRENLLRSPIQISTVNSRKTHCLRGHALVPGNLRPSSPGRACLKCDRRIE